MTNNSKLNLLRAPLLEGTTNEFPEVEGHNSPFGFPLFIAIVLVAENNVTVVSG